MKRVSIVGLVLVAFAAAAAQASNPSYKSMVEGFFARVADDEVDEAVEKLFESNPLFQGLRDSVAQVRTQYGALGTLGGSFNGYEVLLDEVVAERFAYVYVMALYDRQPVKVEFQFYRPHDEWLLLNFSFEADFASDITSLAKQRLLKP